MPENPHFNIKNIRDYIVGVNQQVPLLDGSWRTYVNFDNAASTPSLVPVLDAVNDFAQWYSSVHRGTGYKSQVSTEVYDRAHEIVCRYVGANPEDHAVILVKNSTEALNKLARRLTPIGKRDIILNTLMEHHSNDLPWRKAAHLIHVGVNPDGSLSLEHLNQMLDRYADRVRLVAVTGASNVSGYLNPIHQIAEKAHSIGAQILVDAA
ncbi:MAG: aminotransferase class V-fold PLP-dependent enzyme, partial [Chloroflexota bacterium]